MTFVRTTAINKILKMTKRKRVIPGGTSASKTFGILAVLINQAIKEDNTEISVVSESVPHLRRGALKDFLKIMKETGRYIDAHYNRTLLTYRFANDSYMEFFSADMEERVRGARRNVLFINECNNLSFNTYHQLSIRTSGNIYLDYNPSNEFWVHTELLGESDVESITLTYKDNEALSQSIIDDIERARDKAVDSAYWANWWKVYGLGELGTVQGVIFDDWEIIESVPDNARLLGYGLDFGYTNDPTAVIGLHKIDDTPIYDEVLFSTGLTNPDISERLLSVGLDKRHQIYADSAEPKSIEEIRRMGWRIYPCTKGRDSINNGIQVMQQKKFKVTQRSVNMIKELRSYMWATDKTGAKTGKPIDDFNHTLDAARYISTEKLSMKPRASISTKTTYRR
jgi:phage terminase large subunit